MADVRIAHEVRGRLRLVLSSRADGPELLARARRLPQVLQAEWHGASRSLTMRFNPDADPGVLLRRLTADGISEPDAPAERRLDPTEAELDLAETRPMPTRPTNDAVAQRAYQLYLERGGAPGHAMEDWLQAEGELSGELT